MSRGSRGLRCSLLRPFRLGGGGGGSEGPMAYRSASGTKKTVPPMPSVHLILGLSQMFSTCRFFRSSGRPSESVSSSSCGPSSACSASSSPARSSRGVEPVALELEDAAVLAEDWAEPPSVDGSFSPGARMTTTSRSTFMAPSYAVRGPTSSSSDSSDSVSESLSLFRAAAAALIVRLRAALAASSLRAFSFASSFLWSSSTRLL
mmetsp:Transcript_52763/g.150375  ORF Transcript_52763/g.150375 Transcript_52763/m.150375 type:complete len:205 (+) Transcript_52763:519-1133(+)